MIDSDSDSDSWLVATTPGDSDSDSAPLPVTYRLQKNEPYMYQSPNTYGGRGSPNFPHL